MHGEESERTIPCLEVCATGYRGADDTGYVYVGVAYSLIVFVHQGSDLGLHHRRGGVSWPIAPIPVA